MKEHKMEITPIKKLVITMSLPAIISMTVQALYNIVDSMFIGQYSTQGLTAVSLAFPLQLIIVALFIGLGVGVNTFIARSLGAKRSEDAKRYAQHGLLMTTVLYVFLLLLGLFAVQHYFPFFTNDAQVIADATKYTQICMIFSFGSLFAQTVMSIMQGSGDMVASMYIQLTGAVVNIILDPILIFGWFGFASMGVVGAAVATVIGQIAGMLVAFGFLIFNKKHVPVTFKDFKFDSYYVNNIFRIGLPVSIMQGVGSIMLTAMNLILANFGDVAITVMGIYFKLQSFVFMPVFGLNQGILPILSYNYGSKNKERMLQALRFGLVIAMSYMLLSLVMFQLFPRQLLSLFNAQGEILELGIYALRIISLAFPLVAISVTLSSIFQAVGEAKYSMYSSLFRQLLVLVPSAFVLFSIFGVTYGWSAFIVAEAFGLCYVAFAFRKVFNNNVKNLH
ncbi:MAG: MATE family efflux transporter [Erysipelotrichaceae bacterium]